MRFLFIIFFFVVSLSVTAQLKSYLTYEDTRIDSAHTELDSVLIAGVGTSSTAFFLDNLGEKVIHSLRSSHVKAEYRYLGKSIEEAREEIKQVPLKNYKAVLLFLPKDSSIFDIRMKTSTASVPVSPTGNAYFNITTTNFIYQANFDIRLYTINEKK
ncbi:MAG: hypothetical protein ABUT20_47190, partial [Bacteroidota bacterium]